MQEVKKTRVWPLGQEDPLEEEMATNSSILVWRIPWTEEPGRLQFMGLQGVRHDWSDLAHTSTYWASLVAQMVKNSPTKQETWIQSLGWEDPLEKLMATHSSILAWRIP